jgi:mRNA-degrading endonuclease RelE of RelBE toxin-antitoxin system
LSQYTVYVSQRAWKEIQDLPGNVRQRAKRAIDDLADNPLPPAAKKLDTPEFVHDLRRLRLDKWRIVYTVSESDHVVDVLAIRRRPPYDYGDLGRLIQESGGT